MNHAGKPEIEPTDIGKQAFDRAFKVVKEAAASLKEMEAVKMRHGFLEAQPIYQRHSQQVQAAAMQFANAQAAAVENYYLQGATKGMEELLKQIQIQAELAETEGKDLLVDLDATRAASAFSEED